MMEQTGPMAKRKLIMAASATLMLAACVNLGGKAPPSMLVLTPVQSVASGTALRGEAKDALIILIPEVPRKLETNRVPVQVDASNIAYIKDAIWSDKPASLMQRLLMETIAAKTGRLVLHEVNAGGKGQHFLAGELIEFGVDATRNEAIVIYDAVRLQNGKEIEKRRFEARATIIEISPATAGAGLNAAANSVAGEVAAWVGAAPAVEAPAPPAPVPPA
jgi:cholesterol transport system auxiliary component